MPEGPEVETIRRGLEAKITGQVISAVDVRWPKSFPTEPEVVSDLVVGQKVAAVTRRAKVLMIELANGQVMMFHLKMTGQMVLVLGDGGRYAGGHPNESMKDPLPDKSTRVMFTFESGDKLFFNDQRKFGWIKLVPAEEVARDPLVARLGPEVLSDEFTVEHLAGYLKRHAKAPVKAVILDQSGAAGIGNIYADESLHLAKIHPSRMSGSLSAAEAKRLHSALRDIMTAGIEHGGTSFAHYVDSLGGKGDYLLHARVFRRDGQPCPVCGTTIVKIRVAGRGTHVCPKCQSLPA